jgi:SAM-dependent methyltransferase
MPVTAQKSGAEPPRFEFGDNWRRFARDLGYERIEAARGSLVEWLGQDSLEGLAFLDIGSGSGLFSLAATQMGAERVHSFDYDPESVATTRRLRDTLDSPTEWSVEQGNVLDAGYMESLGQWDIVYAWGVLHHTGDLWGAMGIVCGRVKRGGRLFLSVYNDQGRASRMWRRLKRLYNALPRAMRVPYAVIVMLPMELRALGNEILGRHPRGYFRRWRRSQDRGMDRWHDLIDWVGGYPFEVAMPEEVFEFCAARGFELRKLQTCRSSHGCNQFVFELPPGADGPRSEQDPSGDSRSG